MAKTAQLYEGTTLEFPDDTPDDVIEKVAARETDALRTNEARKPLPAGVKPSAGRDSGPTAVEEQTDRPKQQGLGVGLSAARSAAAAVKRQNETPAQPEGGSVLDQPNPYKGSTMSEAEYAANYSSNTRPRTAAETPHDSSRDTIKNTPTEVVHANRISKALGGSGLGAAAAGTISGAASLGQAPWGIVQGAADYFSDVPGAEAVSDFAGGAANKLNTLSDGVMPKADPINKLIANVFSSTVQSLPILALGMGGSTTIAGGKAVADTAAKAAQTNAMKALFVQQASQEYTDARSRGFDPGESAVRGGIFGAAEVLGERFGWHEQMATIKAALGKKAIPSDQLGRVFAQELFKEIPGEELTTAIEFLADKFGPAAKTPKATLADYLEQAGDTALQTIGQTALLGSPAAVRSGYADVDRKAAVYDNARMNGFNVNPPFISDTPDVQRKKTVGVFNALVAQYGMDPAAAKRAIEASAAMPLEKVGPFLSNMTQALQKRSLVAKPVDEHAHEALAAGPIEDPKAFEAEQKATAKGNADPAQGLDADTAIQTAAGATAPVSRETLVPGEDLSGLSEPARAPSRIDEIAHEAATSPKNDRPEPTPAQKEAENYKVGHDNETIPGERLSVENGAGSTRSGTSPDGTDWSTKMQDHYGRILRTVGMDSTVEKPQHVDFFMKPGTPVGHTGPVFVVDQVQPADGTPDEHKVMFGYDSIEDARAGYLRNYEPGWKGLGAITETDADTFKKWVHSDATSKPFAAAAPAAAAPTPVAAPNTTAVAAPAHTGARVIARVGALPTAATPLELRPNTDGTLTPWHGGHEVLDFESGDPVKLPGTATNSQALQAVKDSGAFGRRSKFFDVTPDSDVIAAPAPAPAAAPAPALKPKASTPGSAVSDAFLERKRAEAATKAATTTEEKPDAVQPVQAPEPAAAAAPAPAAERPKPLTDKQAFAGDYAAFEGRTVSQPLELDTGETATLKHDAARVLRALDARLKTLESLRTCIRAA